MADNISQISRNKEDSRIWEICKLAIAKLAPSGGEGIWGSITGTLANQTDLANELSGKATSAQVASAVSDHAALPDAHHASAHDITAHTNWPTGLDTTELGYVNGVTSAIQTQIDGKPAKVSPSVADNFVAFSDTVGAQKDSGSKASDFATAGHGHSHTALSDIGTNAHSAIDTFISSKAAASGLASLDGSSLVVQNPANATATPAASKIPIADGTGKLAQGWIPGTAVLPDMTGQSGKVLGNDGTDPQWITNSANVAWGAITGTLGDQTDLNTALSGKVDENAAITGATKTKITYDAKGLVTSGADVTTADVADSANKRYCTDAEKTVIGNTSGTNTGDQTLSGLGGIAHSLATAANDFLVASGVGVFVKKTLAETKAVLGLGSAAYTASTDYAAASHTQAASTITPGTFGGTSTNIYTLPGPLFLGAYDDFYGGSIYLYGSTGFSGWTFQLQQNTWVVFSNIDADTAMIIRNTYAGRVCHFGATGYINAVQGFQVNGAAGSGKILKGNGTNFVAADLPKYVLRFVFDGGASEIADNVTATQSVPCTGTITKWRIIEASDTPISGAIEFELYKDAYSTYPATTDITASAPPLVAASATKGESSTLTGWTTTATEGDTIKAKVVSCTSMKRVVLELWVQPT